MSNAYGVVSPGGAEYPTQIFVDNFLNTIDNIPGKEDIQQLLDMGEEAARAYVEARIAEVKSKVEAYFESIMASITNRLKPIEPLINPPGGLDEVIEFCKALAEYFAQPYTMLMEMIVFYTTFSTAAATAITKKMADVQELLNSLAVPAVPPIGD